VAGTLSCARTTRPHRTGLLLKVPSSACTWGVSTIDTTDSPVSAASPATFVREPVARTRRKGAGGHHLTSWACSGWVSPVLVWSRRRALHHLLPPRGGALAPSPSHHTTVYNTCDPQLRHHPQRHEHRQR